MECIIVDDDVLSREIMEHLISINGSLKSIGNFPSAIAALKFLTNRSVDLIFLDINMPEFNGFDFIQSMKNPSKIILTTSDKSFAIKAFEYSCVIDYLVKPIEIERFNKSVEKALSFIPSIKGVVTKSGLNQDKELYVNIEKRWVKINFEGIKIVEAKGDYIFIKTEGKNYMVHSTMKKIEEKLPGNIFFRVHRSFIINMKKIIDFELNTVLIDREIVPVSRSKKSELLERLNLL